MSNDCGSIGHGKTQSLSDKCNVNINLDLIESTCKLFKFNATSSHFREVMEMKMRKLKKRRKLQTSSRHRLAELPRYSVVLRNWSRIWNKIRLRLQYPVAARRGDLPRKMYRLRLHQKTNHHRTPAAAKGNRLRAVARPHHRRRVVREEKVQQPR